MTPSRAPTQQMFDEHQLRTDAMRSLGSRVLTLYYWLATLGVSVAVVLVDDGGDRWLAVLANAVLLGAWYALKQPGITGIQRNAAVSWAYIAIAFVVVGIDSYVAPTVGSFILFVVCPQIVGAMTFVPGVVLLVGVNVVFAGCEVMAQGAQTAASTAVTAIGVIVGVTYFSYRTMKRDEQSEDRALLISQLHATREEAAELRAEQAVSEERMRISRDVHDTVAQGFASILMLTQALDAEIMERPDQARLHADMVKRVAAENLEESRRLVSALAPVALDELSLQAAIQDLARRFGDETGVAVRSTTEGDPFTPERPVQVVALRLCQEALANVRKHARAAHAIIDIGYFPDRLVVTVTDDGRGFDGTGFGYGLRGLMSRVQEIGGTASVDSELGRGTTVMATLPVSRPVTSPDRDLARSA